jgi:predicted O-methyltransferase YrrM
MLKEYRDRAAKARNMDWYIAERMFGKATTEAFYELCTITKSTSNPMRLFSLMQLAHSAPQGPACELGVWNGLSTLVLSHMAQRDDLTVIDSFEGLSPANVVRDGIALADASGSVHPPTNYFKVDMDAVTARFPDSVKVIKGWVPEVLEELPEQKWSFVHIDLDLYDPTKAAIEYFVPRMVHGGIIVEDQYFTFLFPGAGRAWDEADLTLNVLPTGQGVYVHVDK